MTIYPKKPFGNVLTKNAGWTTSGHRHCALLGLMQKASKETGKPGMNSDALTTKDGEGGC